MALPGYENITPDEPNQGKLALEALREPIIERLKTHGPSEPITSAALRSDLLQAYGVKVRDLDLRTFLRRLSDEFLPIGSYGGGFYWGRKRGDMAPSIAHRKARIRSLEASVRCLEETDSRLPADSTASPKQKAKYPLNQPGLFDLVDRKTTGERQETG